MLIDASYLSIDRGWVVDSSRVHCILDGDVGRLMFISSAHVIVVVHVMSVCPNRRLRRLWAQDRGLVAVLTALYTRALAFALRCLLESERVVGASPTVHPVHCHS